SLAKPHAIQQLNVDLTAQSIEVAIISETWFKAHHTDQAMKLPGYVIYRRDRKKRRGGGVAIYIVHSVRSELYIPPNDDSRLEILWIKTQARSEERRVGKESRTRLRSSEWV